MVAESGSRALKLLTAFAEKDLVTCDQISPSPLERFLQKWKIKYLHNFQQCQVVIPGLVVNTILRDSKHSFTDHGGYNEIPTRASLTGFLLLLSLAFNRG